METQAKSGCSVQVCDRVHMYGFSRWKKGGEQEGTQKPYHYFDAVSGVTNVHSFDLSLRIYQRLAVSYPIKLHPDPDLLSN